MARKLVLVMLLLFVNFLCGCTNTETVAIDLNGVSAVHGDSFAFEEYVECEIPKEQWNNLKSEIEALEMVKENENIKGYLYSFTLQYENGDKVEIQISDESVSIDGKHYKPTNFESEEFRKFFDNIN